MEDADLLIINTSIEVAAKENVKIVGEQLRLSQSTSKIRINSVYNYY